MASKCTTDKFERVLVISKRENIVINKLLKQNRFKLVKQDPDFIVCYGGDGTILFAERMYPQVPKLIIKKSRVCRKCDYTLHKIRDVLRKIKDQEFKIQKEMKLEAEFKKKKLVGLNEVQVHSKLPIYAIRFSVVANDVEFNDLIGDGVIVSTPFGSTGYFQSTGGKEFKEGIGVAFNNLHNKKRESFVISEDSTLTVKVYRGPAWILVDNNENFIELKDYGVVAIRKSDSVANFIYA